MRVVLQQPATRPTGAAIPPDQELGLGQRVDDLEDKVARRNFRVVVIIPMQVDQTDLADPVNPRRWIYTYCGGSGKTLKSAVPRQPGGEIAGEWEKVEVWP